MFLANYFHYVKPCGIYENPIDDYALFFESNVKENAIFVKRKCILFLPNGRIYVQCIRWLRGVQCKRQASACRVNVSVERETLRSYMSRTAVERTSAMSTFQREKQFTKSLQKLSNFYVWI